MWMHMLTHYLYCIYTYIYLLQFEIHSVHLKVSILSIALYPWKPYFQHLLPKFPSPLGRVNYFVTSYPVYPLPMHPKFPNNFPLKDLYKLACCWNVTFSGVKHTYLIAHSNIVTAKDDMHGLIFTSCPTGEDFLSLLWDGFWWWTQRQKGMYYLFQHTAGSCIQSQDFPHPALAVRCVDMITNVVALAFTA